MIGAAFVGVGVVGVKYQERTGQEPPAPVAAPMKHTERYIPNLNQAPAGFLPIRDYQYKVESVQKRERDPRLQQWAYAVAYNNAPMTQKKWCGGKRLFSKPEYERWIACLLEKQIITFANPKNPAGGYKPRGAGGWQKIKNIADNREYIPLPAAVMSEAGVRFVSARMRERYAEGEGMAD